MSSVLEQTKQQQVLALGRLGWPASRIAAAVRVDRATVTGYLARRAWRCAAGGVRTKARRNPQFRRRCPPTLAQIGNFAAGGVHRLATVPRAASERVRAASRADRKGYAESQQGVKDRRACFARQRDLAEATRAANLS